MRMVYQGKLEGALPLQNLPLPLMPRIHLPIMERGIKRVRMINDPARVG